VLKPSDNPPVTYPRKARVADLAGQWWVAHTKARQEKALAHDLRRKEISYFLPLIERETVIRGRRFKPLVPLFPGYMFVCGTEDDRYECFTRNRIASMIPVCDREELVDELTQIQRALEADAPMDPWPYLKTGRRARVTAGPFAGTEGIIVRRKDITRLVLSVQSLGQAVAMEIDAAQLGLVD